MRKPRWIQSLSLLSLLLVPMAVWANDAHSTTTTGAGHAKALAFTPVHPDWIRLVLLGIMWVFIVLAVLGPIIRHLTPALPPEPDHGHGTGHDAAAHSH